MIDLSKEAYYQEYSNFLAEMNTRETSPDEVGKLISRLASYYANKNTDLCVARRRLSLVAQDVESRKDDSGKAISSAKAQVFIAATEESNAYEEAKTHVTNLDVFISALRSLQRGLQREFGIINSN